MDLEKRGKGFGMQQEGEWYWEFGEGRMLGLWEFMWLFDCLFLRYFIVFVFVLGLVFGLWLN